MVRTKRVCMDERTRALVGWHTATWGVLGQTFVFLGDTDGHFADVVQCKARRLAVGADNNLRVHSLLDEGLCLLQEFTGKHHDGRCAVSNLSFQSKQK